MPDPQPAQRRIDDTAADWDTLVELGLVAEQPEPSSPQPVPPDSPPA
ncbi:hypothetical protein ACIQFU_23220 [Streptomyces sp. NPDC093065]